jgi:hypothetical protein
MPLLIEPCRDNYYRLSLSVTQIYDLALGCVPSMDERDFYLRFAIDMLTNDQSFWIRANFCLKAMITPFLCYSLNNKFVNAVHKGVTKPSRKKFLF